ncbi:MAG: HlyC/CorC family transporter [Treponema sp.]|nr:HlyC/CorC family transporter [Treponema sp.]
MNYVKMGIILVAFVMILRCVAFFTGSETAFLSLSKIKLKRLMQEKRRNAKTAFYLKENIDELLTIVLVGTNFMNSLASALATSLAIEIVGDSGVGIATLVTTFFATTFGQIVPKTVAGFYPDDVACKNSVILLVLQKIFFPIVWLFSKISKGASRLAGKFFKNETNIVTEEELKALIEVGEREGTLESGEKQMLYKIFRFSDLTVHNIMKHRSLIKAVPLDADRLMVMDMFVQTGVSVIPVYKESKESIVGVIHYKSVLMCTCCRGGKSYAETVMKGVLFVPETFTALELLAKFRKERTEFAVALNEQGQTAGIVTMDDIMRVVFGRMTDEDIGHIPVEARIRFVGANEFIVPGDIQIEEFNSIFKLNLESEEYTTLGGWILERFGTLPSTGEIMIWKGILFIVEDQSARRVRSVRIKFRG